MIDAYQPISKALAEHEAVAVEVVALMTLMPA
jgi:hypothetical protein